MINDLNKKCKTFASVNKTNISVTDMKNGQRIDYYNFDIPRFIEKKTKTGIGKLFIKYKALHDRQAVLYKDRLRMCWLVYILKDDEDKYIVRLGPFLNEVLLSDQIKYLGHRMKLSMENVRILENFFSKIPVYEENEILNVSMILTNLLRSRLDDFELIEEHTGDEMPVDNKYSTRFTQYDFAAKNYEIEQKIMKMIETGDTEKLNTFLTHSADTINIPVRHRNDPLRNAKNLAITANSLAARAALRGGLNPNLVHSISTKYAVLIEKQISVNNVNGINIQLVSEYCRSVHEYSLSQYSPLIKKAVIYIRKNLYENISLKDIAGELHVNSSYLSRVFKKNIGQNITEYIHESKINESLALVKSKSHEIIEIANIFGYCNTAYFSTQFKKVMGISPREFQKTNN